MLGFARTCRFLLSAARSCLRMWCYTYEIKVFMNRFLTFMWSFVILVKVFSKNDTLNSGLGSCSHPAEAEKPRATKPLKPRSQEATEAEKPRSHRSREAKKPLKPGDQRTRGPGPGDQSTRNQRTRGPGDQRTRGPEDQGSQTRAEPNLGKKNMAHPNIKALKRRGL